MTDTQAVQLFKCLADRSRLQILRTLAKEEMYVELLAQRLDLTPSTVSFHLKKLTEAGLVSATKNQYYTVYTLRRQALDVSLLDILSQPPDEADLQARREDAYRRRVLETFFEGGRLKSIPVQRKKERIVLEELARAFAPGRAYSEREVNLILSGFYDDFCTLRRDLISEQLMTRKDGIYRMLPQEEAVTPRAQKEDQV